MIWVRSNYVIGNKWISAMPYWKMCEKKYDKSYAATFYFSDAWVICSLKISWVRQIFITSFFLFEKNILCGNAFLLNSLICITCSGGKFQSPYHFLQPFHFCHWAEYNWWYASIFSLKVLENRSILQPFISGLSSFHGYLLCFLT